MMKSVQEYIAANTEQVAEDLLKAGLEVPEDRRGWSPLDKGRTVLDQVAECAVLNKYTAEVLEERVWPKREFPDYQREKEAVARDWDTASATLKEHLPRLLAAIRALGDDELDREIETQFGPMTLVKIAGYPHWNMSYHQGQVTYIALLVQ